MTDSVDRTKLTMSSLRLLYNISRELAMALDLRTVLQRILSMSLSTVQGSGGSIIVFDSNGEPIDSAIIYKGQIFDGTTDRLRETLENGLAGWVVQNREAALVNDTSQDDRWITREYPDMENVGSKSSVSAPLLVRDRLVGVMTLSNHMPNYFTKEHLDLVRSIADQAAIAVQNAGLYEASLQRAGAMEALANSAASINAALELSEVLDRILEQTSKALKADAVSLALVDNQIGELEFRAATGIERDKIVGQHLKMGQGIAGWVAQEGIGVIVPEARKDPRFFSKFDRETGYVTEAIAVAPIRLEGEVIGVLEALNPKSPFTDDDLLVLDGIGNLAGTAIEHARLFNELQSAHRRYRELFEDSVDPILISNLEGQILEANRQAALLTEFSKEDLLEMNVHHFHQVDWDVVGSNFKKLTDGETLSYESQLRPKEGDKFFVEVYVRKVDIEGKNRLQWIFRDITEIKELDKLREDLVSMIYHDLRSPLANVVSGLDLLQSMVSDDPSISSVVEIALRSTERIQRLASSLLDASRLEAGQRISTMHPVSLKDLVQDAVDAVTPAIEASGLSLAIKLPKSMPDVMVDADLIKRVLINLLENAIKFTAPGSAISLGASKKNQWMKVWVEDQGTGIHPDVQDRIFDKFISASTTPGRTQGLGLGLAFCKLAVEDHGGEIWVESETAKGAKFVFTIPIAP